MPLIIFSGKIVSFAAKASPHISNYRELFLIPFFYVLVLQKKVQIAHFYQRDRRAEFDTFFLHIFFASRFPLFVMMKQRGKTFEVEEFSLIISRLTNTFLSKRRNNVIELPLACAVEEEIFNEKFFFFCFVF